jgi:hypothetical protein
VLSERERRVLARIERHLTESDPALAEILTTGTLPRSRWANPVVLLVTGLLLLVFGCVIAAVPVALLGIAIAVGAMYTAHRHPRPHPI